MYTHIHSYHVVKSRRYSYLLETNSHFQQNPCRFGMKPITVFRMKTIPLHNIKQFLAFDYKCIFDLTNCICLYLGLYETQINKILT